MACPYCRGSAEDRIRELEKENEALLRRVFEMGEVAKGREMLEGKAIPDRCDSLKEKEIAALQDCWGGGISLVQFTEDSPHFEKQVSEKMEACAALSAQLSRIVEASKKWKKKSHELQEAEIAFSEALKEFNCPQRRNCMDLFVLTAAQFGSILKGMADARDVSVSVLEATFTECVEQFNTVEVDQTRELHRHMTKAFNDYNSAMSHFLNMKKPVKFKSIAAQNQFLISLAQKESDAIVAFEQYELCRLDLSRQLNRLEIKRQYDLAEAVVRGVFALQSGIKKNYENMMLLLPECKGLQQVFPSIHSFLQEIDSSFGQLRFELCRTLCRSVKLSSTRLDGGNVDIDECKDSNESNSSIPSQVPTTGTEKQNGDFADSSQSDSSQLLFSGGKGLHSRGGSIEFMRRFTNIAGFPPSHKSLDLSLIQHTLSANNGFLAAGGGTVASSRMGQSRRGGQLNTADSFLLLKKSPALIDILRSQKDLKAFLDFVLAENNSCHIAFWLDVERFRIIDDTHSRNIRAQAIFERYIVSEDSMLLLSHGRKSQLTKGYEECLSRQGGGVSRNFFDQAQSEVLDILSADTYTRFLRSDEWTNCQLATSTEPARYDPRDLENLLDSQHLISLRLIGVQRGDTSIPEDQIARSIVDSNSRVIIHGPFDISAAESFTLEYVSSKALSLLDRDLHDIYVSAKKSSEKLDKTRLRGTSSRTSVSLLALSPSNLPKSGSQASTNSTLRKPKKNISSDINSNEGEGSLCSAASLPVPGMTLTGSIGSQVLPLSGGKPPKHNAGGKHTSLLKSRIKTWAAKRFTKTDLTNTSSSNQSDNPSTITLMNSTPPAPSVETTFASVVSDAARVGRYLSQPCSPVDAITTDSQSDRFGFPESAESTETTESKPHENNAVKVHKKLSSDEVIQDDIGDMMVVKEGYLRKRSSKMRKTWKRRWFILRENRLYYIRDFNDFENPELVCECMLATVREADPASVHEMQFCFELLSPNRRTYVMQAESEASMRSWVDAIRTCTEKMITGLSNEEGSRTRGLKATTSSYTSGTSSSTTLSSATSSSSFEVIGSMCTACSQIPCSCFVEPGKLSSDEDLKAIQEQNLTCAECGSPQPDWAIINLGVLVCIECSGIHRSLGVHISKVRSMTLDSWSNSSKSLLRRIGNVASNEIWEKDIQSQTGWNKPLPSAPRTVKERFIKAKYLWKGFIGDSPLESEHLNHLSDGNESKDQMTFGLEKRCCCSESSDILFLEAIKRDDAQQVMWYIVHGALEMYTSFPQKLVEFDTTPLHEAAERASLGVCEILLQNGAKALVKLPNKSGKTPLDLATRVDIRSLLSSCA